MVVRDSAGLPPGWTATEPGLGDLDDITRLMRRHEEVARGWASTTTDKVVSEVIGRGAPVREHLLVRDAEGQARGLAEVHNRASVRIMVAATVCPDLPDDVADGLATRLFAWIDRTAPTYAKPGSGAHLDSGAFVDDPRQQRWLVDAGYRKVRTWWQMKRPAEPAEGEPGNLPEPRAGVTVRQVQREDGMPDEDDLHRVHEALEEAFEDHFNSYYEDYDDFLNRLRTDPGHRWDHWWLAELTDQGPDPVPAGALVGSVSVDEVGDPVGSYVEYLGVRRLARGRGVAKALLNALIADTAARGRGEVGLEVDADSPTKADQLYLSMGFRSSYETQSWHKELTA